MHCIICDKEVRGHDTVYCDTDCMDTLNRRANRSGTFQDLVACLREARREKRTAGGKFSGLPADFTNNSKKAQKLFRDLTTIMAEASELLRRFNSGGS